MARGARELRLPRAIGPRAGPAGRSAVVVGGGLAGVAAATVLSERGVDVTLVERESFLGGRAGAWSDRLSSGEPFEMERGFHAFFRQYYNLRALLRRIDPELELLVPLEDYPILGPDGEVQSFRGLPRRTPFNVMSLTARSPALGLGDLIRVNGRRALEMLTYDAERTYGRRDHMSAGEYLDSLRFPPRAEREMSAGELLMMFHFYFTGNPEGLVFDVARRPFSRSIWHPFERYLEDLRVTMRMGESSRAIERVGEGGWRVLTDEGRVEADSVVLAVTVPALQDLVAESPDLGEPEWRHRIESLELTNPFAVWRLWLDRPTDRGRAPFVGTTGLGPIDNISLYHLFEDESREWHERHGGAIVELHAYAVETGTDDEQLKAQLLGALHALYPETRNSRILEQRYLVRQDCPAFAPGSHASRPPVETPFDGVTVAGDFVKLPIPSALMERAVASGFLAANYLLARDGVCSEPIRSIPPRGLLTGAPVQRPSRPSAASG
jgi:isorenieratene synthase